MATTITDITTATQVTNLNDTDLTHAITTANQHLTSHKARFILMITDFHHRALATLLGAPNTVTWLMRTHNLARSTAFEYLKLGAQLPHYPLITHAFLSGNLAYSTLRFLLPYLTTDNEEELLQLAQQHSLAELEQLLAGRDRPRSTPPTNDFTIVNNTTTGGLRFWGHLDPERAAELLAALKLAELANLRDISQLDPDLLNNPDTLDTLITTATEPAATETGVNPQPEQGSLTRFGGPARAGLISSLFGMINMVRSQPTSSLRAPGAQVNVLITQDGRAVIPGRHGGQTGDLLRSVVNGDLRYHLLDRTGVHLNLTRSARVVSAGLEQALLVLWGFQCAAPGCVHTRFLEFHHLHAWSDGGQTNVDNLVPLCSGCHSLVTGQTMTIVVEPDRPEFLRFRLPGGRSFTSIDRQQPVADEHMGPWRDDYSFGQVPIGDEYLVPVWHDSSSFADPTTGKTNMQKQ